MRTTSNTGRPETVATRAGHLGEHDDPDHADGDGPQQLIAEGGAGLSVEDELADVDEAADGGDDPQGDLEELLHSESASARASRAQR